jgi:hypothetical protein
LKRLAQYVRFFFFFVSSLLVMFGSDPETVVKQDVVRWSVVWAV